jgi:hypothetical protein
VYGSNAVTFADLPKKPKVWKQLKINPFNVPVVLLMGSVGFITMPPVWNE